MNLGVTWGLSVGCPPFFCLNPRGTKQTCSRDRFHFKPAGEETSQQIKDSLDPKFLVGCIGQFPGLVETSLGQWTSQRSLVLPFWDKVDIRWGLLYELSSEVFMVAEAALLAFSGRGRQNPILGSMQCDSSKSGGSLG